MNSITQSVFNVETLADCLIKGLQNRIVEQGLSEIELPPTSFEFSKQKLGVLWEGTLVITGGKFRGLQTIHRIGVARLNLGQAVAPIKQNVEVTFIVDLGITKPSVFCEFDLVLMNRESQGTVTGRIKNSTFNIILAINIFTRKIRVASFKFKEIGNITAEISGLGFIFDYIASKAVTSTMNRKKQNIRSEVERKLSSVFKDVIEGTSWPVPDLSDIFLQHKFQEKEVEKQSQS